MPSKLHPAYECHCSIPVPMMALGEDTGLCQNCSYVYDENLYERRLHQHAPNFKWESVGDFLLETNEDYQRVVANSPVE